MSRQGYVIVKDALVKDGADQANGADCIDVTAGGKLAFGILNSDYTDNSGSFRVTVTDLGTARLSLTPSRKSFVVAKANRSACSAPSGESSLVCTVANGATVRFYNRDGFRHGPLFNLSALNRFRSPSLRPGACFEHRFANPTGSPIVTRVYDEIHSQERLTLRMLPG